MRATRSIDRIPPLGPPQAAPASHRRWCSALAVLACVVAGPACSAATAASGSAAPEALVALDARLAQNPKDTQLQFRRGMALAAAGRTAEAIAAFKRLIDEHPELAPAYNNLAALKADQGDDESARALLQKAVQLKPGYATALHNLGDVHLRLAAAAYGQAAKADPNDSVAAGRVTALRMWPNNRPSPTDPGTPALMPVAAESSASHATAVPAALKPPAAATPAQPIADSSTADVAAVVRNWADDWERRDADAYVGYYAPDFKGRAGSHAEWLADRKDKLTHATRIKVSLSNVVVSVIGSDATVHFRQDYVSDKTTSVDQKVLRLVRNPAGRWLITREAVEH